MATIALNYFCDLNQAVKVQYIDGNVFSGDNAGNTISVFVMDGDQPATIGGSVSADVIRADGSTVAVSGALDGNRAYVILPQACYAVPGSISIVIKNTQNTTITTIAALVGNVYRSSTDDIVDPGTIIPSISSLIASIDAAIGSIPADYSALLASIAADYSSSKTYPVGAYCWEAGVLKRCIVPITSAETYTAAHWTNAVIGDDLSALKSAINVIDNDIEKGLISKETGTADNVATGYVDNSGEYHSNSGYKSYDYYITPGKYDKLTATGANNANSPKNISFITFINGETRTPACLIASSDANIHTETVNVPSEATIVTICVAKNYVDTYGAPTVEFLTINSITEAAKKEETIIAENIAPTYLSHRYIAPATYLPTSTTSSGWDLYKLNVDGIDEVLIRTYFKSGASSALPFWTIVDTDFDEVTSTNQTTENIVSHDKKHNPTTNMVEIHASIPVGGKTMLLCCATDNATSLVTVVYNYHYFKTLEFVVDVPTLIEKTNGLVVMKQSPYYRDVRWGCPCFNEYYHSSDNGTSEFPSSTTAEQYFTKFNSLVSDYSGYAESHEMGLASDGTTMMYYYTFYPKTNQDSDLYKRPKIIVSAGQHGFEKTANFGVYYFAKDLLENWQSSPVLSYIRNHVQLILMPVLNPYGFDNDVYVNANGVNLNRNWDTTGWSKGTQGTTTYGGEEPLDQPETQYASAVILANLDALWLCDYHNNGQTAPSGQTGYLWHSFALVTYDDEYFKKAIQAAKWHIDEITGHLYIDYPTIASYENSGIFTDNNAPSHQGLIVAYAREHNIMAATMEGGAAFIGSGNRYSSPIGHMNADLLGNWIRCLLATFSHYAE